MLWLAAVDRVPGLDFDPETLERFSGSARRPDGRPHGTATILSLSKDPVDKWRRTLANPIRKEWCRRYLRFLGADRLKSWATTRLPSCRTGALPVRTDGLIGDSLRLIDAVAREPIRVYKRRTGIGGPSPLRALL